MHRFKNYGPYEFVKWLGNCIQNLAILVTLGLICVYCYNEVKFDVNNIIHIILFLLILLFNIGFASWLKNIKIETEDQQKFKTNLTILYILSMFICFGIALNLNHFLKAKDLSFKDFLYNITFMQFILTTVWTKYLFKVIDYYFDTNSKKDYEVQKDKSETKV